MPRFLSVKNLEKYQHYKHRNPPWIKLHLEILDDPDFLRLSDASKWHYIGLILLASRHDNAIPPDHNYIQNRLGLTSKLELTPRFLKQHVLAPNASSVLARNFKIGDSETEKSRDRVETEAQHDESASAGRADQGAKRHPSRRLSDEEFLAALKTNPAYAHLNLDHELGKMDAWLSTKPGKQKTRRFIVNWLNRVEKPLINGHAKPTPPPFPPSTDPIARNSWRQAYGDPKAYGY